jgi:hypothetical protein
MRRKRRHEELLPPQRGQEELLRVVRNQAEIGTDGTRPPAVRRGSGGEPSQKVTPSSTPWSMAVRWNAGRPGASVVQAF